jgi:protein-tyrosine phosphatase
LAFSQKVSVTYDRFSIQDLDIPTRTNMNQILDQIDLNIRNSKPVYVHCWGGRGRTGTVVGCWMVRHGVVSGSKVTEKIRYLRRNTSDSHKPSPETPPQVQMVETWG